MEAVFLEGFRPQILVGLAKVGGVGAGGGAVL